MIAGSVVLRPEPGNAETAARLEAAGVPVRRCPLFAVAPVAWTPPDPTRYDALLLTSANAPRHAGPALSAFVGLPVLAVGARTAHAARAAGLDIALIGDSDAAALIEQARARGWTRLLHLAGRDRGTLPGVDQLSVYASDALPIDAGGVRDWEHRLLLLHSARAARRAAALVDAHASRGRIALGALSPAIAEAAGGGWQAVTAAATPTDGALIAAARGLIDPARRAADKVGA